MELEAYCHLDNFCKALSRERRLGFGRLIGFKFDTSKHFNTIKLVGRGCNLGTWDNLELFPILKSKHFIHLASVAKGCLGSVRVFMCL